MGVLTAASWDPTCGPTYLLPEAGDRRAGPIEVLHMEVTRLKHRIHADDVAAAVHRYFCVYQITPIFVDRAVQGVTPQPGIATCNPHGDRAQRSSHAGYTDALGYANRVCPGAQATVLFLCVITTQQ